MSDETINLKRRHALRTGLGAVFMVAGGASIAQRLLSAENKACGLPKNDEAPRHDAQPNTGLRQLRIMLEGLAVGGGASELVQAWRTRNHPYKVNQWEFESPSESAIETITGPLQSRRSFLATTIIAGLGAAINVTVDQTIRSNAIISKGRLEKDAPSCEKVAEPEV